VYIDVIFADKLCKLIGHLLSYLSVFASGTQCNVVLPVVSSSRMHSSEHIGNAVFCLIHRNEVDMCSHSWLRGTVVECRLLTGKLSLFYARPTANR